MNLDAVNEFQGTPESVAICESIAKESEGVCLLAFSRGKDSTCAWLWLRRFFKRIIPFHMASVPHLQFVDSSLEYYENVFQTKIERLLGLDACRGLSNLWYQPIEDEDEIDRMDLWNDYSIHNIADLVRDKYNCPNAWLAQGISIYDSVIRRKWQSFRRDEVSEFYPCYDWKVDRVLSLIKACGVRLPDDYLMSNRTFHDCPNNRFMTRLPSTFPQDHEQCRAMFPFIDAVNARNEFRKMRVNRVRYYLGERTA